MDKRLLQTYSVWAKDNLEKQIEVSLKTLGIKGDKDIAKSKVVGEVTVIEGDSKSYPKELNYNRQRIIDLITSNGYENTIEQFAYTWFNRFIALRYMEVHEFLPHGFRVLSDRNGGVEPEILKNLTFVKDELKLDMSLCSDLKEKGKTEELYRYVLFRQCRSLAGILPMLFAADGDYMELMLPQTLLKGETVLTRLLEIPEENFLNDVEIIGWMYQFYISVKKDEVFASKKTITKDTLPAVTQLFTPDWIVRYMAENSVGRIWLESYPKSNIKGQMKYYVDDAEQTEEVQRKIDAIKYKNVNPEDIKIIEPCCGSGHILVYVFDLLYLMYDEKGYSSREIPTLILKNNLIGLDVDKRAAQLAAFSLVMKARSVNPRFFSETYYTVPKVYEIKESKYLIRRNYKTALSELGFLSDDEIKDIEKVVNYFKDGKTIGSLLKISGLNFDRLDASIEKIEKNAVVNIFNSDIINEGMKLLKQLVTIAKALSAKYDVMITNPPYIGISSMEDSVREYAQKYYPNSKTDMFAMFMETSLVKSNGFTAMINMHSWMFLSSYEKMRKSFLMSKEIVSMVHLGAHAFETIGGEVVQTTSFVLRNNSLGGIGTYFRLVDSKEKEVDFVNSLLTFGGFSFLTSSIVFMKIPGTPIAYWLSQTLIDAFTRPKLYEVACTRQGLATGDNEKFMRFWHEVSICKIFFNATDSIQAMYTGCKWFPCNKGGGYRKWYGNRDRIINWLNNGAEIKNFKGSVIRNPNYYFLEGGTWSTLASNNFSMRFSPKGSVFESKGSMCFANDHDDLLYIIGFLNTKVVNSLLMVLSPTLDYHEGPLSKVPIIIDKNVKEDIIEMVERNIETVKKDWDSDETSWDFLKNPLI